MLAPRTVRRFERAPARQRGVTLIITLIVLVSMMIAVIGLTRSVDTTNIIAGNLSFKQAAVHSGDAGVEAAVAWLEKNSGSTLYADNPAAGYHSKFENPAPGQSWDDYWNTVLVPSNTIIKLPKDSADNWVAYTIHRLCPSPGSPNTPGQVCATSAQIASSSKYGTGQGAGEPPLSTPSQQYYRITVQITGPRATVSYVQAIVML